MCPDSIDPGCSGQVELPQTGGHESMTGDSTPNGG